MYRVDNITMGINYGDDKVRFPSPVNVGAKIRARAEIVSVTKLNTTAVRAMLKTTVEILASDKPAVVAESILLDVG